MTVVDDRPADALAAPVVAALAGAGRIGVAFSGGVDSSVLLALAVRAAGADQRDRHPRRLAQPRRRRARRRPPGRRVRRRHRRRDRDPRAGQRRLPGQRPRSLLPLQGRAVHPDRRRGRPAARGWTPSRTARTPTTHVRPDRPGAPAATRAPGAAAAGRRRSGQGGRPRPSRADLELAVRRQTGCTVSGVADSASPGGHPRQAAPDRAGRDRHQGPRFRRPAGAPPRRDRAGRTARRRSRPRGHRAGPVRHPPRSSAAGFRFAAVDLAGIQSGAFTLPLVQPVAG